MVEFLQLWDLLSTIELQLDSSDTHFFHLSTNGIYSAKLAYESFFIGPIEFEPYVRIWKSHAPPKCRFFMWLVAHNKC
jgi:hypothetical protein